METIFKKLFELLEKHPNDYEFGRETRKFLNEIKENNQNKDKDGGK